MIRKVKRDQRRINMNKKELNELKRQIKWDNDLLYIPRIASAYASISSEEKKVLSYEIKDFSSCPKRKARCI